ncbi:hypothetical protein [Phenylobacterium sp.]|uniref:hypothetical protein n=1 Tax=Phenylobacterium sp. TaxID=1871053 RepID=UPI002F927D3D
MAGALAALAASGGLAWWFVGDDDAGPTNLSTQQLAKASSARAAAPLRIAERLADEAQVRRAWDQFQTLYADLGVQGLEDFSRECARALDGDPRIIDYCLAFDAFAASVAPEAPWFAEADVRQVELARAALPPGVDPAGRIAEVRRLTRVVTGAAAPVEVAEAAPPPAPAALAPAAPSPVPATTPAPAPGPARAAPEAPPVVQRAAAPKAAPTRAKLQKASAPSRPHRAAGKAAPTRKAANRCRLESTPAARALCENPDLRVAERRLKRAYELALAAGVDRQELDRQQAEWRTAQNVYAASKDAIARSYEIRIGQLEATAQAPQ